jgi:ATP-dependent phosphofructokinase / diphosphate-dependent phosphofructokinase
MKKAVVAMGGGPTRVINRSLFGVVDEAAKHGIDVFGARHGITGVFAEDFIPLTTTTLPISTHTPYPGAMIGSTRHKPDKADCQKAFEIFKKNDIHYFFYIGGNDTSEATSIINHEAKDAGYELRCFHVPKTVDNDLVENDHTPGYGSAARFVAHALLGDDQDVRSLPGIKLNIIMGRKAGWLTAASSLCKTSEEDGPHLIYVPERTKSLDDIITDILGTYDKYGRCVVALSEGINGPDRKDFLSSEYIRKELATEPYSPIIEMLASLAKVDNAAGGAKKDAFGHVQLSGSGTLADVLASAVKIAAYTRTGKKIRCRADTFGYLQRSFAGDISEVDAIEAEGVGRKAVEQAAGADVDGSISIQVDRSNGGYEARYERLDLDAVAGKERYMPNNFLNEEGNGVTQAFLDYARPIVGELLR